MPSARSFTPIPTADKPVNDDNSLSFSIILFSPVKNPIIPLNASEMPTLKLDAANALIARPNVPIAALKPRILLISISFINDLKSLKKLVTGSSCNPTLDSAIKVAASTAIDIDNIPTNGANGTSGNILRLKPSIDRATRPNFAGSTALKRFAALPNSINDPPMAAIAITTAAIPAKVAGLVKKFPAKVKIPIKPIKDAPTISIISGLISFNKDRPYANGIIAAPRANSVKLVL